MDSTRAIHLLTLPLEILTSIAFEISCPRITDLTPFLQTCHAVYERLHASPPLYARIFRSRFSSKAIARRAFVPTATECYEQLVHYSLALKVIRIGLLRALPYEGEGTLSDVLPDTGEVLGTCIKMLLEDDGWNYAQLEAVRAYGWVKKVIKETLYEDSHRTGGWPLETRKNSSALWALWMLSTKEKLEAESAEERDDFVVSILPFVAVPYRYPTAHAPVNHFHLPLSSPAFISSSAANTMHALSIPTHHGPFPVYLPSGHTVNDVHFGRRLQLAIPPISIAAKLLYFSRRELFKFGIPPHLPPDREEAVRRATERRRLAVEQGSEFDADDDGMHGPTREDLEEWNGQGKHVDPKRPGGTWLPQRVSRELWSQDSEGDASRKWDGDWWRMRTCGDPWSDYRWPWQTPDSPSNQSVPDPLRLKMGNVYEPGTLTGLWAGRMMIPAEALLHSLLFPPAPPEDGQLVQQQPPGDPIPDTDVPHNASPSPPPAADAQTADPEPQPEPSVPIPPGFSEDYLGMMTVPVYMRLAEHVCYHSVGDKHPGPIPSGGPYPSTAPTRKSRSRSKTSGRTRAQNSSPNVTDASSEKSEDEKRSTSSERRSYEAEFEQGVSNGWFPSGTEYQKTWDGDGITLNAPSSSSTERRSYTYETLKSSAFLDATSSTDKRQSEPGRFHDTDTCPGCILREEEARRVRDVLGSLADDESNSARDVEHLWESVGLGRDQKTRDEEDEDMGDEEEEDYSYSGSDPTTNNDGPVPHSPTHIPPCPGIIDLVITGGTDARHGNAWNHYSYVGRVRAWDGLVGILRMPADRSRRAGLGNVVFWGYIVGGENFVGSWRVAGEDLGAPGWEGGFSLGKRE